MNPILPLNEYVPDVEAHVFGDRVYLYGSHDKADSDRFCVQDYVVYSSAADDLKTWEYHGVSYRKEQDPRSTDGKLVDFYAPDCVRGNDGRYYLYYSAMGPNTRNFGPMSVAVSSNPEGPFEYWGDISYPDGTPVLRYMNNDPAVINDGGRIYLYYGWGLGRDFRSKVLKPIYDRVLAKIAERSLEEVRNTYPSILSMAVTELDDDMKTVKYPPKAVLDSKTTAPKGTTLYDHPFYEAPSIRKIGDLYYLVYSSAVNNELAYATSRYPDRDFEVRGAIISNTDLGYRGNTRPLNNASTIHGSIECINGNCYVFYHRSTNNTDYSRQVCMERIEIGSDGTISQVEMTSSGIDRELAGKGTYEAGIACHLITPKPIRLGIGSQQKKPRIAEKGGKLVLKDLSKGVKADLRYFDLTAADALRIRKSGDAEILVNGGKADSKGEYLLPKEKHACITLEVTEGHCDIEELEFIVRS